MALSAKHGDGGAFTARVRSEHSKTQAWLIEQFLPVKIELKELDEHCTKVVCVC